MAKPVDCSKLIYEASRILEHQKEISILKGENFNLFSILKMESKENATHSAFLGELLNPEGSHNFGNTFLKLFFEIIEVKHIDLESARVRLEHHIGERNDTEKTGGRVDIYIWDKNDYSICIENKIDAPDQNVQIERYCNYKYGKNKVFYLTLDGEEPNPKSYGKLVPGEDFHLLSYFVDIVQWLTICAKEACNFPIIRESIQQYIILIKKLTNQLTDNKMADQIQRLITENYLAAKTLESNAKVVELKYTNILLNEVKLELDKKLKEEWIIEVDDNLNESWSGMTVKHRHWPERVYVKLEGQSKVPWSDSIYGIIGNKDVCNRQILNQELEEIEILKEGFKSNNIWPFYKTIMLFTNDHARAELFEDEKRKRLVENLAQKLLELSTACEKPLKNLQQLEDQKVSFN